MSCTSTLFTYYRELTPGSSTLKTEFVWSKVSKSATQNIVGLSSPDILYPNGTIVDIYQKNSDTVIIKYFNKSGPFDDFPNQYAQKYLAQPNPPSGGIVSLNPNEIVLTSTSGDVKNVLLRIEDASAESPSVIRIYMYSLVIGEHTVLEYPVTQVPCINEFSLDESIVVKQQCVGTTLRRVYHDGEGGVSIVDTPNSDVCGYVPPIPEVRITEIKRIKIVDCIKYPIQLVWKNTLGGWDQWIFGVKQTYNINTESEGNYRIPMFDLSDNPLKPIGKSAVPTIILGAENLTLSQKQAIKTILYSNKVYILSADLSEKTEVSVSTGSFLEYEISESLHKIEFEIVAPEINTIKN